MRIKVIVINQYIIKTLISSMTTEQVYNEW